MTSIYENKIQVGPGPLEEYSVDDDGMNTTERTKSIRCMKSSVSEKVKLQQTNDLTRPYNK